MTTLPSAAAVECHVTVVLSEMRCLVGVAARACRRPLDKLLTATSVRTCFTCTARRLFAELWLTRKSRNSTKTMLKSLVLYRSNCHMAPNAASSTAVSAACGSDICPQSTWRAPAQRARQPTA